MCILLLIILQYFSQLLAAFIFKKHHKILSAPRLFNAENVLPFTNANCCCSTGIRRSWGKVRIDVFVFQLPQSAPRTQQQQDKGGHQDRGAAGTKGSPWVRQSISWEWLWLLNNTATETLWQTVHTSWVTHFYFKLKISSLHQQNVCLLWGGWRVQLRQRNGRKLKCEHDLKAPMRVKMWAMWKMKKEMTSRPKGLCVSSWAVKVCRWEDGGKCSVQPRTNKGSGFGLKPKSKWLKLSGFS